MTLVPLGDHTFAMWRHEGDRLTEVVLPLQRLHFVVEDGRVTGLELVHDGEVRAVLQRLTSAARLKDETAGSDTVHVAPPVEAETSWKEAASREIGADNPMLLTIDYKCL